MSKRNLADALSGDTQSSRKDVERAKETATGLGDEPTIKFNCNVPESLHRSFKETCEQRGHTMTWVVQQMMEEYVEENS